MHSIRSLAAFRALPKTEDVAHMVDNLLSEKVNNITTAIFTLDAVNTA